MGLEDGAPVPIAMTVPGVRPNTGRHRWLPAGGALAFEMEDEKGVPGIAVQDVALTRDTGATRRAVAGFASDTWTESLGVSPDGARLTVSERQETSSLLSVEGIDGVVPRPIRGAAR